MSNADRIRSPDSRPPGEEAYAAFPSEGDIGKEHQHAFEQLEDLERFLIEHAGESVFLRIHLGASHMKTQADDPMKPIFGIKRYTVAYATAVFPKAILPGDACDDRQNCPDALIRTGSDEPGDATVDVSVRLDRYLHGGVAIAVVQNNWFRAQVSSTQFGIRLKGYFFNTGEPSYADQLSVTPYTSATGQGHRFIGSIETKGPTTVVVTKEDELYLSETESMDKRPAPGGDTRDEEERQED